MSGGSTATSDPAAGLVTLRAHAVTAGYGRACILRGIDLEVRTGEVLGLIGPNGAGKSTLLRALAGLIRPQEGTVTDPDTSLTSRSARDRARRVAFLPQDTSLDLDLPAREIVALGRYAHRSRWRAGPADAHAINDALVRTGADAYRERHVAQLSGGQRQLVLVAKLLAQEARTLLLDEPVSALDLGYQLDVLMLLAELARDGHAVVLVLHDLELAARFCDRLVLLQDGRVRADGAPAEVLTSELLGEVYRVRAVVTDDATTGGRHVSAITRLTGTSTPCADVHRPDRRSDHRPSGATVPGLQKGPA